MHGESCAPHFAILSSEAGTRGTLFNVGYPLTARLTLDNRPLDVSAFFVHLSARFGPPIRGLRAFTTCVSSASSIVN